MLKPIRFGFIAKMSKMSNDRSVIVLPKNVYEEGKRLRGKYIKVTVEEDMPPNS
ncbi:MAG: hypothetical protein WA364_24265 [Candidatus Nitrosopolaris sp.]